MWTTAFSSSCATRRSWCSAVAAVCAWRSASWLCCRSASRVFHASVSCRYRRSRSPVDTCSVRNASSRCATLARDSFSCNVIASFASATPCSPATCTCSSSTAPAANSLSRSAAARHASTSCRARAACPRRHAACSRAAATSASCAASSARSPSTRPHAASRSSLKHSSRRATSPRSASRSACAAPNARSASRRRVTRNDASSAVSSGPSGSTQEEEEAAAAAERAGTGVLPGAAGGFCRARKVWCPSWMRRTSRARLRSCVALPTGGRRLSRMPKASPCAASSLPAGVKLSIVERGERERVCVRVCEHPGRRSSPLQINEGGKKKKKRRRRTALLLHALHRSGMGEGVREGWGA
eukprot:Rhum_TRINITY_DN14852_c8_g1::Rhum_TRINITY_DN14852_c8_g1_i1::g.123409::m.123409